MPHTCRTHASVCVHIETESSFFPNQCKLFIRRFYLVVNGTVYLHKSLSSKSDGADEAEHLRIHKQTHTHKRICTPARKERKNEREKEVERERDLIRSF